MTIEQITLIVLVCVVAYLGFVCYLLTRAVNKLIDDFHERKSFQNPNRYNHIAFKGDNERKIRESVHNH